MVVGDFDRRPDVLMEDLIAPLTPHRRGHSIEALATADLPIRTATLDLREIPQGDPLAHEALTAH